MPEPINKEEDNNEEQEQGKQEEPAVDVFGQGDNPKPEDKSSKEDDKGGEGDKGGDKKFDAIPEDHPTIVKLNAEIDKVKTEYEIVMSLKSIYHNFNERK